MSGLPIREQSSPLNPLPLELLAFRLHLKDDQIPKVPKFRRHQSNFPPNLIYLILIWSGKSAQISEK